MDFNESPRPDHRNCIRQDNVTELSSPPGQGGDMKARMIVSLAAIAVMALGQTGPHPPITNAQTIMVDSVNMATGVLMRSGLAYISHIGLDYVSVLDPETNRIIGRIKSGNGPSCVELSEAASRGYIANNRSNEVTVFDRKTGESIAMVPAGEHPSHLILTNDSRYVLVGHESATVFGFWIPARTRSPKSFRRELVYCADRITERRSTRARSSSLTYL